MLLNGRHYSLDSRIDLESSSASANPADHGRQKPRLHRCFHLNFSGQPTYFPNSAYCTTLFDNGTIRLLLTAFACFLHFVSHIFFFYVAIWLNLFYNCSTGKPRFKRFFFQLTQISLRTSIKSQIACTIIAHGFLKWVYLIEVLMCCLTLDITSFPLNLITYYYESNNL